MSDVESLSTLFDSAVLVKSKIDWIKDSLNQKKLDYKSEKSRLAILQKEIDIQTQTVDIFKTILDLMTKSSIGTLEQMLNSALTAIFYDRSYRSEIQFDESLRKSVQLFLIEKLENDKEVRVKFDAIGGGIKTVIGFVFNVFYLMYFGLDRILFLDESFSMVSKDYMDRLFAFMNVLSEEEGFRFVMITHDPRIIDFSLKYPHSVYLVDKGSFTQVEDKSLQILDQLEVESDQDAEM